MSPLSTASSCGVPAPPRRQLCALCACGPLGLCGGGETAALQVLAALLLGRVQRSGDRLTIESDRGDVVELQAVPETDWLAWEALCAELDTARPAARRESGGRRLLRFRSGPGPLPEISETSPRCGWTRRWLDGALAAGFSVAATPRAPPAGW